MLGARRVVSGPGVWLSARIARCADGPPGGPPGRAAGCSDREGAGAAPFCSGALAGWPWSAPVLAPSSALAPCGLSWATAMAAAARKPATVVARSSFFTGSPRLRARVSVINAMVMADIVVTFAIDIRPMVMVIVNIGTADDRADDAADDRAGRSGDDGA